MKLPSNYVEVEQLSPEWLAMRKGLATGSMVKQAVAKMATQPRLTKKCADGKCETCEAPYCNHECHGPRAGTIYQQCREDYLNDVVTTRLTGQMSDRYVSKAMQDGVENEPLAIAAYENRLGVIVEPIGFVFHPGREGVEDDVLAKWYGCSPDGLIGSDIVIEAKCPTQAVHMRYLREANAAKKMGITYIPEEHIEQCKSELSCTERPLLHFVSFHPKFPTHLQLLVIEWRRDKGLIRLQEAEVAKFLDEAAIVEQEVRALKFEVIERAAEFDFSAVRRDAGRAEK